VVDLRQIKAEATTGAKTLILKSVSFTPQSEVDLCGHATVAAFWLLAKLRLIAPERGNEPGIESSPKPDEEIRVYQQTKAGVLAVRFAFRL